MQTIDQLLTSNDEPSEEQVHEVRRLLMDPKQEAEYLDAEIQKARSLLQELEEKRTKAGGTIRRYEAILSPIRRVPPDVLRVVFLYCLVTHRNPAISIKEAPLLLTHVCSSWRTLALNTPALWARIHISFTNQDLLPEILEKEGQFEGGACAVPQIPRYRITEILRIRCEAVEEWLRRSAGCSLAFSLHYTQNSVYSHIYVINHTSFHPEESSLSRRLFKALSDVSSRWQHVRLTMSNDAYCAFVESWGSSYLANNLVSFRILISQEFGQQGALWEIFPGFSLAAPNMKILSAHTSCVGLRKLLSPWPTALTHISIDSAISTKQAAFVLQRSPQLVHVKMCINPLEHYSEGMLETILTQETYLPELRTFLIKDFLSTSPCTEDFYDKIIAPNLSYISFWAPRPALYVDTHGGDHSRPLTPLRGLLLKSIHLKTLVLSVDRYTCAEISELLRSATTVTHLVYRAPKLMYDSEWGCPSNSAHEAYSYPKWKFTSVFLSDSDKELLLLPNLEKIEIDSDDKVPYVTDQEIIQFVINRLDPSPSSNFSILKDVKMKYSQRTTMDVIKQISEHAREVGVPMNDIKLDLKAYRTRRENAPAPTSTNFGLKEQSKAWDQRCVEEQVSSQYSEHLPMLQSSCLAQRLI
uniref:F-box domain-containing protein n=1 Tax=Psilocybe cubensis TaxID=181762 RepID=A0A8H7Y5Y1_PSICU